MRQVYKLLNYLSQSDPRMKAVLFDQNTTESENEEQRVDFYLRIPENQKTSTSIFAKIVRNLCKFLEREAECSGERKNGEKVFLPLSNPYL